MEVPWLVSCYFSQPVLVTAANAGVGINAIEALSNNAVRKDQNDLRIMCDLP